MRAPRKNENTKLQAPSSRETSNTKLQGEYGDLDFGIWNLELLWSLELGAWRFLMRLGTVIGRVTLSQSVPALAGARWLIVSPFTREHFQQGTETPAGMSKEPTLVV